jgi:transcriptional regulator with XRE-family HTH domain
LPVLAAFDGGSTRSKALRKCKGLEAVERTETKGKSEMNERTETRPEQMEFEGIEIPQNQVVAAAQYMDEAPSPVEQSPYLKNRTEQEEWVRGLATNLAKCRIPTGLTQRQVGKQMRIPRSTIALLESGLGNPSAYLVFQMSEFYKISLDRLVHPQLGGRTILQNETMARRSLASGLKILENRNSGQKLKYKHLSLPPQGSVGIQADPSCLAELVICQKGAVWIRSEVDSKMVRENDVVECKPSHAKRYSNFQDQAATLMILRAVPAPKN